MSNPEHLYWDSCVFWRYLTGQPPELVDDIDRYVRDAKKGDRQIYFSTLSFVEIRQSALKAREFGSIKEFFEDMGSALYPIEPNPNILFAAGELKSVAPTNPSDAKTENVRVVGTVDAIHLMTCIYARDVLGLSDIVFHTFDDGKGKTWEGKCVPLLSFEKWFPEPRSPRVVEVCGLSRCRPEHPQPSLLLAGSQNALATTLP